MIKNTVLEIIKNHKSDLTKYHVQSMFLFGSVARDEETIDSDIDILVNFSSPATFDLYMDLKFFLEDLLNRKVDLVTESSLGPVLRKYVNQDLIRAA
ncbi:MAG: nucleotidyltransferase family protein [Chlamydiales bacterium]|nr:nucleotidyltransferase family protein [Chlamydiales bacterium]